MRLGIVFNYNWQNEHTQRKRHKTRGNPWSEFARWTVKLKLMDSTKERRTFMLENFLLIKIQFDCSFLLYFFIFAAVSACKHINSVCSTGNVIWPQQNLRHIVTLVYRQRGELYTMCIQTHAYTLRYPFNGISDGMQLSPCTAKYIRSNRVPAICFNDFDTLLLTSLHKF